MSQPDGVYCNFFSIKLKYYLGNLRRFFPNIFILFMERGGAPIVYQVRCVSSNEPR